jgi:glutamine amidotransferase
VRPTVVVLDHGSGNLRSAQRALQRVGAAAEVSADAQAATDADGLFVPGVGAFAACVAGLRAVRGDEAIRRRVAAGRPVLGVCVGMQVLFRSGNEHGERSLGLGLFDGDVEKLHADRLPHMGWNTVDAEAGPELLRGLSGEWFYFVHSYAAHAAPGATVAWAEHGEAFVAAVERDQVAGTQFHPEKSADAGAAVLSRWVAGLR